MAAIYPGPLQSQGKRETKKECINKTKIKMKEILEGSFVGGYDRDYVIKYNVAATHEDGNLIWVNEEAGTCIHKQRVTGVSFYDYDGDSKHHFLVHLPVRDILALAERIKEMNSQELVLLYEP